VGDRGDPDDQARRVLAAPRITSGGHAVTADDFPFSGPHVGLTPHPQSTRLAAAIQQSLPQAIPWKNDAFRFADLAFANLQDLVTGEGSRKAGGSWNPKGGFATLYLSVNPETALHEVLAHHRNQLLPDVEATPVTLAGFRVDVRRLLDMTDRRIRRLLGVTGKEIREPWHPHQHAGQEAITQAIGRLAYEKGFQGLLVPSAALVQGRNLARFPDRLDAEDLTIVHEERFPRLRLRLRRK